MNPAMRMRQGVGDYGRVPNYSWMFNPPPFGFLNRKGVKPPPQFIAPSQTMGLGCGGGGCTCGGKCGGQGMGLFDSLNPTTWGLAEWAIVAGAAFVVVKIVGAGSRRRSSRQFIERAKWGT